MKNKILLSTLLGGALMAGCTADDVLEVNKDAAGKVNPAAPVFTVSFGGDELTRATMGNTISWDDMDKMSLYHGGGSMSGNTLTTTQNFFANGILAYTRNAVYASEAASTSADGTPGAMEFKTSAMVLPGAAVMVFPADTKLENRNSENPIISVNLTDQDENTRNLTPYVSEILKIDDAGENNGLDENGNPLDQNSAGYGRKYDIAMRRIGGELRLKLKEQNRTDVLSKMKYNKIAISVDGDAEAYPFTDKMEIKFGRNRNYIVTGSSRTTELGGDNTGHEHWAYTPWIEPTSDGKKNEVSTKYIPGDLENGFTAYFSLLPPDDRDDKVFTAVEGGEKLKIANPDGETKFEFRKPLFSKVKIRINTTYGYLEYEGDNTDAGKGATRWAAGGSVDGTIPAWNLTLFEGLGEFLYSNFRPREDGQKDRNGRDISVVKEYKGQLISLWGERTLTINLQDLKMNGLHIEDEEQLNEVLDVYKTISKDEVVNFILDGGKSNSDYPGKFKMTSKTWARLETLLKQDDKVHFALCNKPGEACSAIVLDNTGNTSAAEVPALQFVTDVTPLIDPVKTEVNIELVGAWKYESVTTDATKKNFENVNSLILVGGEKNTLSLKNNIAVSKGLSSGIFIQHGATVNVTERKTDVYLTLTNNGKIVIDENGELRAAGGTIINNYEKQVTSGTALTGLTAEKYGTIENSGILGINMDVANGRVNNYGLIDIKTASANTLVSTNATDYAKVSTNYSGGTTALYIGTINIDNATESKVTVQGQQGFIKKTIKTETTTDGIGDLANYLILDDGCTKVTADEGGLPSIGNWERGVKYIEVKTENLVTFTGTSTILLEGLIVPTGSRVDIDRGTQLTMHGSRGNIYMQGTIVNGGTIKYGDLRNNQLNGNATLFKGYFGEGKKDITTVN